MKTNGSYEAIKSLGEYVDKEIPRLKKTLIGFPPANYRLQFPSVSLNMTQVPWQPRMYQELKVIADNTRGSVLWSVGEYEFNLQLDIWAATESERYELIKDITNAFIKSRGVLILNLPRYYEQKAYFSLGAISLEDSEIASQTRSYRATASVSVSFPMVTETEEYLITDIELDSDITFQEIS